MTASATAARQARRDLLAATGIVLMSAAAGASLDAIGRGARGFVAAGGVGGPEVVVVRTGAEALAEWRRRGVRGRVLVHAGRFLHFVEDPAPPTGPGPQLAAPATPLNYLRVAARTGVARRILYVSPPDALEARLAVLGHRRTGLPALLASETFPRALLATFPPGGEPVLLELSASWFDDARAPDLADLLVSSGVRADLVVVNLAEDATDVSEAARDRARALAAALRTSAMGRQP